MNAALLRSEVVRLLVEHLRLPVVVLASEARGGNTKADLVLEAGKHRFVAECKSTGAAAATAIAIEQAMASARQHRATPLVVVPFMGAVGAQRCRAARVSWMDLSGNIDLTVPGIRVHLEGRPNRFKRRGRPENVFAPMSSRVARCLLAHPTRAFTQKEISAKCDLGQAYAGRIVHRLEADGLVERVDSLVRVRDPDLLLDAWLEKYEFGRHHVIRGHVPARTSEDLVRTLVEAATSQLLGYAFTGLSAAWRMAPFAEFRLVSLYVTEPPGMPLLERIGFREEPRGANVYFVVPNDNGVFQENRPVRGVNCVHPVQVFVDLKDHPERSKEAAEHLRATTLKWGRTA